MSTQSGPIQPFEVVIAGGGVASVESALALRELAADRLQVTLVAPNPEFVLRPMTVREPFAFGAAQRFELAVLAAEIGADLVPEAVASVSPESRQLTTESGRTLGYGALLVALGAHVRPRYEHVITVDDRRLDELLHGLVQDIEGGYVKRLAFVIPPRPAWPFPAYELALMSAQRAYDSGVEVQVTLLTPEPAPLAVFGGEASRTVGERLAARGVKLVTGSYCEVPEAGVVTASPDDLRYEFDRIVALPKLDGPGLPGLPQVEHGFIPIDEHAAVRGLDGVYAAGDATDFAVKHGGIAAQQADAAAQAIAARAGAPVEPRPFEPVIQGMLLTGGRPLYLSAHLTGGHGDSAQASEEPLWTPTGKIAAQYLARYLDDRSRVRR